MIALPIVIQILFVHWYSDFVRQTDKMAKNKSTSWYWLSAHVLTYTALTAWFWTVYHFGLLFLPEVGLPNFEYWPLMTYAVLNGVLHFGVDAVTSRITSKLYKEGRIHDFFVIVGLYQLIHYICLFGTFVWMFGR